MRLLLIRHAEASSGPPQSLTETGRREHRRVGEALKRMGVSIDRLLSSPLLRARETAVITARALDFGGPAEETPALGDGFTVEGLLERLGALPAEATVACIGHEPHLSRFTAALVTAGGDLSLDVKKSGVIGIQCQGHPAPGKGTLLFLFRPDELLRLLTGP